MVYAGVPVGASALGGSESGERRDRGGERHARAGRYFRALRGHEPARYGDRLRRPLLLVSVVGVAVVAASEASIINSFIWNERWTFVERARSHGLVRRCVSFHTAYLGGLLVSLIIVAIGVGIWGRHVYLLAHAVALPGNFLWTYAASNWLVWRPAALPTPAPGITRGVDTSTPSGPRPRHRYDAGPARRFNTFLRRS